MEISLSPSAFLPSPLSVFSLPLPLSVPPSLPPSLIFSLMCNVNAVNLWIVLNTGFKWESEKYYILHITRLWWISSSWAQGMNTDPTPKWPVNLEGPGAKKITAALKPRKVGGQPDPLEAARDFLLFAASDSRIGRCLHELCGIWAGGGLGGYPV